MHIRTRIEQRLHDLGVTISARPAQRLILRHMHIRARIEQQLHGLGMAVAAFLYQHFIQFHPIRHDKNLSEISLLK
jgi:hypothetical protein